MKKEQARTLMNELGSRREPFICIIDYKMERPLVYPLADLPDSILFDVKGFTNYSRGKSSAESFCFQKHTVSFETYEKAFCCVQDALHRGDSFLTNLTFKTPIETDLSLKDIFVRSSAPYKLLVHDQFVVFSPEVFVKIDCNKIASFPMKGTIDASFPKAEQTILEDAKETAEHATIVDLIRNDISMVASNVHVKRYRYIDRIRTNSGQLLQVSSEICGDLHDEWNTALGDILFGLLPAGSICGAPKPRTLEIIDEAETYKRGYYTGVFGIFDGKSFDSAVMIRFIEQKNNNFVFKSGGGITAQSKAVNEYQELINKVYVPFT